MNRRPKRPRLIVRDPAYRRAFERLDAALEDNTRPQITEKLYSMLFGDLDEPEQPDTVVLPE